MSTSSSSSNGYLFGSASPSYSFTSGYTSNSDTDSDLEEVQVKQYLFGDIRLDLIQYIALKKSKKGIKRHYGHYQLDDHCHAKIDDVPSHYYKGKHWDVPIGNDLSKTNIKATAMAIQREIEKEQQRRIYEEEQTYRLCQNSFFYINQEFFDAIDSAKSNTLKRKRTTFKNAQVVKDHMQGILIQKIHKRDLDREMEEERQRQIKIMENLSGGYDLEQSPSTENLLKYISVTNQRKHIMQEDLLDAMELMEEDEEDLDGELIHYAEEMKDRALREMKNGLYRIQFDVLTRVEQFRRANEFKVLAKESLTQKCMKAWDELQSEMNRHFALVLQQVTEAEYISVDLSEVRKRLFLEQLSRRAAIKFVDKECAEERKRRIQELEEEAEHPDPAKEILKETMANVQIQLVVDKFHGYKVTPIYQEMVFETSNEDRKKRKLRLSARRRSNVTLGEGF
ncbi:uncharacterized protein LOC106157026 [Lingula anatina]|uniref:Uncharacterized protein LOC106157026 n=1 Tax=Lingula anatina TaxID=7574 RepID=A0A1S3HPG4_LINAN|nr:uncharacterized protein LOC106157026 [Lingula anatina]XP_013387944.1 uncharacterized protein LOC106157026 [Lingula anatina]|eukprot:XP_013387943.1 uncharacterized protein LOC106157026 [Lingula anatina]